MCSYNSHPEADIETQVASLREELRNEGYQSVSYGGGAGDTHQIAEASQKKKEQLRAAFGIRDDYVEGSAFDLGHQAAKSEMIKAQLEKEQG